MIMANYATLARGGAGLSGGGSDPKQGYELEYSWKQVDRGPGKDEASIRQRP